MTAGVKQYWKTRKDVFSPAFAQLFEELAQGESTTVPSYPTVKKFESAHLQAEFRVLAGLPVREWKTLGRTVIFPGGE